MLNSAANDPAASSSTWACPFGSWSFQPARAVMSLLKGIPPQARWKGSDSVVKKACIRRQQRSGCFVSLLITAPSGPP